MKIQGDYSADGYALVERLVAPEVVSALLHRLMLDLQRSGTPLSRLRRKSEILNEEAYELSGEQYPPLATFLWGLTPAMQQIAGRDLIPTYDYFRIYRGGALCLVHADRPACEHSMSLTLGYSDAIPWELELESVPVESAPPVTRDFGGAEYSAFAMRPGDAVAYRGIHHRHGRTVPNPNRWSAHLFLHWVDPEGPHADQAFDGKIDPKQPVDFAFS